MPAEFLTAESVDTEVSVDASQALDDIESDSAVLDDDLSGSNTIDIQLPDVVSVDSVEDVNAYINEADYAVGDLDLDAPSADNAVQVSIKHLEGTSENVADLNSSIVVQATGY